MLGKIKDLYVKFKTRHDRANVYLVLAQRVIMISMWLAIYKETKFGEWFYSYSKITIPVLVILYLVGSYFIGARDEKSGIRRREQGEIGRTNPHFTSIHNKLKSIENKLNKLNDNSTDSVPPRP